MGVVRAGPAHLAGWAALRAALWPDDDAAAHAAEAGAWLADDDLVAFVALDPAHAVIGFVEASVRHDYVNGCDGSPVGFVEGLFVDVDARGQGVGRALLAAVEEWAAIRGLTELASDALLDNSASHAFHRAAGFEETERVVYFRKLLDGGEPR